MTNAPRTFREFEHAGWENSTLINKYHEKLSVVTTQSVEALLNAADVRSGSKVLDVATGAGYNAAAAVNRGAEAIGIDFSAAQVALAKRTYPDGQFRLGDAEALPFAGDTFDAVVNGFGMCHLPNPDLALREAWRVLKPGGKIAFAVWDAPERTVGFGAIYAGIRAHGTMDTDLPAGPNFFLFSDPAYSTAALERAGFVSAACRQARQVWVMADPDELFEVILNGSVRAAATLRAQKAEALDAIRRFTRDAVCKYQRGDRYEVPMPAVVATGTKP